MSIIKDLFPEVQELFNRRKRAFIQHREPNFLVTQTDFEDNTTEVVLTEMSDWGESMGDVFKIEGEESVLRARFNAIMEIEETMFEEWSKMYILEN